MNGLDLIILLILAVAGIGGFIRGLAQEVFSLAAWFLAAFAIHTLHTPVMSALAPYIRADTANALLTFSLLMLVPYAAMKLVAANVSEPSAGAILGPIDRVLGFGFGTIKGVVIAIFAFSLLMIGFDESWGYRGRPTWIVTARAYPVADTLSRELVPLIAARRDLLRDEAGARDAAAVAVVGAN